jgi:NADH:ubiquinone oxidoreductase subunit 5 (subunit L)/multisubunit Na+/H+ antiporter MnhA subunit
MAAEETSETDSGKQRTPLTMIVPPAVLVVAAVGVGLIAQFPSMVQDAAIRFEDQAGYNATVLAGAHVAHPVALAAAEPTGITLSAVLTGLGSMIGALILPGPVLAPPAAAAPRLRTRRRADRAHPALPERRD